MKRTEKLIDFIIWMLVFLAILSAIAFWILFTISFVSEVDNEVDKLLIISFSVLGFCFVSLLIMAKVSD